MDINDFRKHIFLNSQYCTYYTDKGGTVLAGIMRNFGYKYADKLSQEKLTLNNAVYRNFTTLINCLIGAEILLYVYFFIFPNFLKLMQINYFIVVLMLSAIPLIMLYLTYIAVNYFYEKFLVKNIGTFQRIKFNPTVYNIDFKAYEQYKKSSKMSSFVLVILLVIFLYYIFTPIVIDKLVYTKKYSMAVKTADLYSKIIPISSDTYVKRAYAKFKLGKYEDAVKDYELANKYSLSNLFDKDILGVKTYYMPYNVVIKEFDSAIYNEKKELKKQYLSFEKARYLMKNKKYNEAAKIYDALFAKYEKKEPAAFDLLEAYHNRGLARAHLGDISGSKIDLELASKICQDCKFSLDTKLVRIP